MSSAINWVDAGILAIIGLSVIIGLVRGFVKEALSLVTWVAALSLGYVYYEEVATLFTKINMPVARQVLAFVLIVLATLITGGIITYMISKILNLTGFKWTDKMIGTVFGIARGTLIVAAIIAFVNISSIFSQEEMWVNSSLVPQFTPTSTWLKEQFFDDFIAKFKKEPKVALDEFKKNHIEKPITEIKQQIDAAIAP